MSDLNSVVISEKADGSWQAVHIPSGRTTHGLTKEEAETAMRDELGMDQQGDFTEPLTSNDFEGLAKEVAVFLEGPVSEMLSFHSGFARLVDWDDGIARIRLGGGCQGCPSSTLTLLHGVKQQLQTEFGEDQLIDVEPVVD